MIFPKDITKQSAKKYLEIRNKDFIAMFVSGSNLHPNPKLYKYYWWIYAIDSKEDNAEKVFYQDKYRLTTKEFMDEYERLNKEKISFAYVNVKYHRLGAIFNYDKLKQLNPDIEFAPKFDDDNDEISKDGHK